MVHSGAKSGTRLKQLNMHAPLSETYTFSTETCNCFPLFFRIKKKKLPVYVYPYVLFNHSFLEHNEPLQSGKGFCSS